MKKILVVDDDRVTAHVLRKALVADGFSATVVRDGVEALEALSTKRFDLLLLDVWMPRMNGLEVLAELRSRKLNTRVVVMTSDDTPETVLKAVRDQAFRYVHKPIAPPELIQTVRDALAAPESRPIDVVSAKPEWVELVVPCSHEAAERIQAVMAQLDAKLDPTIRERLAVVFRELLMNAIEWGGQLDPNRTVRIACLRTPRMLMYRIADPGPGFNLDELSHAAIGQSSDDPIAHMAVREERGIRPGGFGLLMVKEIADELIYNEKRNEVVFVKYLAAPA
jgi:CheY-like chemotaxis protein/anti-sigma regulatory factor (Ser/Thr protein kinase)